MSHKKIITKLQDVRFRIDTMKADDNEIIISAGADLEALLNDTSEHNQEAYDALIACLQSLQAIFQGETANAESSISLVSNTIVAVEQILCSGENEISQAVLASAFSALNNDLGQDAPEAEIDSPQIKESEAAPDDSQSTQKPVTFDDLALLMLNLDENDKQSLEILFESIRDFSEIEEDVSKRKALVKAARIVQKFTVGKTDDFDGMIEAVGTLIDSVNQEMETEEMLEPTPDESEEKDTPEERIIELVESIEPSNEEEEETREEAKQEETKHTPDVLADDTDLELVAEFAIESGELLEAAETALLDLEADPNNVENIDTVFRGFHTIKGSAAYLGLKNLTSLAHLAESLLSRMREKEILCAGGYADLTLISCDMLKGMLDSIAEALSGGTMNLPANFGELITILESPEAAGITEKDRFEGFKSESEETSDQESKNSNKQKKKKNGILCACSN